MECFFLKAEKNARSDQISKHLCGEIKKKDEREPPEQAKVSSEVMRKCVQIVENIVVLMCPVRFKFQSDAFRLVLRPVREHQQDRASRDY